MATMPRTSAAGRAKKCKAARTSAFSPRLSTSRKMLDCSAIGIRLARVMVSFRWRVRARVSLGGQRHAGQHDDGDRENDQAAADQRTSRPPALHDGADPGEEQRQSEEDREA